MCIKCIYRKPGDLVSLMFLILFRRDAPRLICCTAPLKYAKHKHTHISSGEFIYGIRHLYRLLNIQPRCITIT